MTHFKHIFCPPKSCSDSLPWVLFFACLVFYCVFLQSCFYLYNIYHISNNVGTMLCKLVSYIGSSSDWDESREKIGLSHTGRPKFRDTTAAALNLIRTQKHQKQSWKKSEQTGSWHVREGVACQEGCDTAVRACHSGVQGSLPRWHELGGLLSGSPGGTNG